MKQHTPILFQKAARAALLLYLGMLLPLFASACGTTKTGSSSYMPTVVVTGDVANEITLSNLDAYPLHTVQQDGKDLSCVQLSDVFQTAQVQGELLSVYFSSPDGVMASMPLDQAQNCYLTFANTGWTLVAPNHPPQARMKQINTIVVCAGNFAKGERCLRITQGEACRTLSYGQLFLEATTATVTLEGEPQKQLDGKTYNVNAYTRRNLIPLSSLVAKDGKAICYQQGGAQQEIDLNGYLEWRGNSADYVAANRRSRIADVIGLWINPPSASVTDVAQLSLDALQKGRVLVVEIDGLGYNAYTQYSKDCPMLKKFNAQKARTVMPSISNVALASIVTGKTPDISGVKERKDRELAIADMFSTAAAMKKSCAVIEGDSVLVTMNANQTLSPDQNGNGSTDDEVQQNALLAIDSGSDFLYVHYHGLDDVSHTTGPLSDKACQKAKELDQYIADLLSKFHGTAILISDHGMHDVMQADKLGMHGTFLPVDMLVPLGILQNK